MADARSLTISLGGRWHGAYGTAPCPVCQPDRRNDQNALSLRDDDGRLLAHCHKSNCSFQQVLAEARCLVDDTPRFADRTFQQAESARNQAINRSRQAERLWLHGQPIAGSLVETYLRTRGITCSPPMTLRFHPKCWHGPTSTPMPAMIAKVEGSVHRTFLRTDGIGKADLSGASKMMLGTTIGGAVRLTEAPGDLVVAEGIETALSLACGLLRCSASIWAALSAAGLRALVLPKSAGRLVIAPNGDSAGSNAADVLAERATALGWEVHLLPAPDGKDWNDVLNSKGAM